MCLSSAGNAREAVVCETAGAGRLRAETAAALAAEEAADSRPAVAVQKLGKGACRALSAAEVQGCTLVVVRAAVKARCMDAAAAAALVRAEMAAAGDLAAECAVEHAQAVLWNIAQVAGPQPHRMGKGYWSHTDPVKGLGSCPAASVKPRGMRLHTIRARGQRRPSGHAQVSQPWSSSRPWCRACSVIHNACSMLVIFWSSAGGVLLDSAALSRKPILRLFDLRLR